MGEDKDESDLTSLDDAKISAVFIGSALASGGDGVCGETLTLPAAGPRLIEARLPWNEARLPSRLAMD